MLDDARKFLELVLPWPASDATGPTYCNIHWRPKDPDQQKFWGGRAYTNLSDMMKGLYWATQQEGITDIYTCMSSQNQAEIKVSQKGKTYARAIRFQNNVVALRSLFMDVDVKDGAYASREEAIAAIVTFAGNIGLPAPSAAVATGSGGLHVHWAVSEYLSRIEWEELAFALQAATVEHGLITDTACTIDSARILRIPNTLNYKHDPPRPVTLLRAKDRYPVADLRAALAPFVGRTPIRVRQEDVATVLPFPRLPALLETSELSAGIENDFPQVKIEDVAAQCGFVSHAILTNGADYNNPLWTLTTSLAVFTEDGRANAHFMSSGHAGYDPVATDNLFDRMERGNIERNIGWPSCAKIEADGAKSCVSCPLRGKVKSPLNIAAPNLVGLVAPPQAIVAATATANAAITDLPFGYSRSPHGEICRAVPKEDGTIVQAVISSYPMENGWIQEQQSILNFHTRVYNGKTIMVSFPIAVIHTRDGIGKALGQYGMVFEEKKLPFVKEFIVSWVKKLQESKDTVVSASPFGWVFKANGVPEGFTYAGKVWLPKGETRPGGAGDVVLARNYSPKGDLDAWKKAIAVTTDQQRPDLNVIVAAAFAGPLVPFTQYKGLIVGTYSSESGIGKTTAMRAACSVWGNPSLTAQKLDDTPNSVIHKIGILKNIPIFWDELKGEVQMDAFGKMAFNITQGAGKARLHYDITQREVGDWQTLLVSASNDSLVDSMNRASKTSNAGLLRIFEFPVEKKTTGLMPIGEATRMSGSLDFHHGQAGLVYAQYLGANGEAVAKRVAEATDKINNLVKVDQSERLWTATIAVIFVGAQIANELGLTNFDVRGMLQFMLTQLGNLRKTIKSSIVDMKNKDSVKDILAMFLGDMRARHTVWTNRVQVSAGNPGKNQFLVQSDITKLDSLQVQIGKEDGIMRVSSTYLSRWLAEHEHSRHMFTSELKKTLGVKEVRGRLCGGTPMSTPTIYLLEIDLNSPEFKGFME